MPRDYRLHEINDREFERLVVRICVHWLGEGVQPFTDGPDGGRDGKFHGTAARFPSENNPLSGHFVLQAKHVASADRSCSDRDFERLMRKEHPKVKRLNGQGICDHYMAFTNRKLAGKADEKIIPALLMQGVTTAHMIGTDRIHIAIDMYQDVKETLPNLNDTMPFRFDAQDLRDVIAALHDFRDGDMGAAFDSALDFETTGLPEKNKINGLTAEYYREVIYRDSLPHFKRIEAFLKNPRNEELAAYYHDSANDLKGKILVYRNRFEVFDHVFLFLAEEIQNGSSALRGKRRMILTLLHYMYCNCDIGSKGDVAPVTDNANS
jgi:hypothetical protein